MLKERKLLRYENSWMIGNTLYESGEKNVVGWYTFNSWLGGLEVCIKDDKSKININEEDYYFTEFESEASESDYHSYSQTYSFKGVYLAFNLNDIDILKYFGKDLSEELFDKSELLREVERILNNHNMLRKYDNHEIIISDRGYLQVVLLDKKLDKKTLECANDILKYIRKYYDKNEVHITRMFGSYILLKKVDGELQAIKATPISIKYCPLMIKLLHEVGDEIATTLIESMTTQDESIQTKKMCQFINEVVIKGGYFDTNRLPNSCETNILFEASKPISSSSKTDTIAADIIVSNNLDDLSLQEGDQKQILLNSAEGIKVLKKRTVNHCSKCPYPCT